jgi:ankyrin repeat protein
MLTILLGLTQASPSLAGVKENQRLIHGVVGGFPDWIHEALQQGADMNGKGGSGEVALHVAIRMHKPDMVKLLLKLGADVNAKDAGGTSALHWAVYHERLQTAQTLIDRKADVNAKNAMGVTPLHLAASYPAGKRYPGESTNKNRHVNIKLARLLLSHGAFADPKAGPKMNNQTPLSFAVSSGNYKTAQLLLEKGADPKAKNAKGFPLLDVAAISDNHRSIPLLIKYGANPEQKGPDGYTPLLRAIYAGKARNVAALINGGADTKNVSDQYLNKLKGWRDDDGRTAVHIAAGSDGDAAIGFCVSKGFLLGNFDKQGWTPLHTAAFSGSTKIVIRLLKAGVPVDSQQAGRDTPLIVAAQFGKNEMVTLLLKNGANPDLKGAGGYTALHTAAVGSIAPGVGFFGQFVESEKERAERESIYETVIRSLLAAGADKTLKNGKNRTPYEEALHHKNKWAAKILKP